MPGYIPEQKKCSRCNQEKSQTEFYRKRRSNGGIYLYHTCKDCWSVYNAPRIKQWRIDNQEHVIAKNAAYLSANREHLNQKKRQWYYDNRERALTARKSHYAANKEHYKNYNAANKDRLKSWRLANKERVKSYYIKRQDSGLNKASCAAYYAKNKESLKASGAAWRAKNKELVRTRSKIYYAANKELNSIRCKAYRAKNKEYIKASVAKWHRENRDKHRIYGHNRENRIGDKKLSSDLFSKLNKLQKGKCACCKCGLNKSGYHFDHIMPLALGGLNTDDNIQLLCPTCNLKKGAKHPIKFMQENGLLL